MKIAIVCDWLVTKGGAENFLGHLLQCYPTADVYAVIDFIDKNQRDFLLNKPIYTSFMQKLPFVKKYYRHLLPIMPYAIEQLDLSAYDLIISSSHAVAKGVITGPNQLHISYVHTPMRYAWDLQHQYLRETGLDKKLRGHVARYFLHKLRLWDVRSAHGVDYFLANSNFIARRILKTYRRSAETIYPPVDLSKFIPGSHKENFYLAVSRFVPYKRIDLIVESFQMMPNKKLVVIGDGPDFAKIKSKAGLNVKLLGYQTQEILIQYLQAAKALIFAAEEDFGLTPIEAQACGTPVIAYGKGGALETIRDLTHEKPTGVFFAKQTCSSICESIELFEQHQTFFSQENCVNNSKRFSYDTFKNEFTSFVENKIKLFFDNTKVE